MAGAFTYNGIDMSAYSLTVTGHNAEDYSEVIETIQTKNRSYISGEYMPPRSLLLDVVIYGTSIADLKTKLDNVVKVLRTGAESRLVLDGDPSRLYKARFKGKSKRELWGNINWTGTLEFACPDPLAYSTAETSSDFNIDADPKIVTETVGGTTFTRPIWTLTAGETLTDVTIKLENQITGEELQWTGSLNSADTLEIDCRYWTVKKNGASSMTISGSFPRLAVGANPIKVTGLSTTGSLNIRYRTAYI